MLKFCLFVCLLLFKSGGNLITCIEATKDQLKSFCFILIKYFIVLQLIILQVKIN